jgi:hypothetical protein
MLYSAKTLNSIRAGERGKRVKNSLGKEVARELFKQRILPCLCSLFVKPQWLLAPDARQPEAPTHHHKKLLSLPPDMSLASCMAMQQYRWQQELSSSGRIYRLPSSGSILLSIMQAAALYLSFLGVLSGFI